LNSGSFEITRVAPMKKKKNVSLSRFTFESTRSIYSRWEKKAVGSTDRRDTRAESIAP